MSESLPQNHRNAAFATGGSIDSGDSPSPLSSPLSERPQTFRQLYDEHFDFVWRFAAHRGVPAARLEEAVQEVFVVVHRRLVDVEDRSALRTWLAGITRNVVVNHLRRYGDEALRGPLDGHEPDPAAGLDHLDPAEVHGQKSPGELLDVVLRKMTGRQREAFILCEMEGFSPPDAAQAFGVPEATLRARLFDARKVYNSVSALLRAQRFWVTRQGNEP
jgi:RNA polymerase sigma-70 factor, ECF subfamily